MCLIALLSACGTISLPFGPAATPQAAVKQRPAAVVALARATTGEITSVLSYAGVVQPRLQVNVVPRSNGRIEKIHVDTASVVKQGDLLVELDHATLDAQVRQAEANLLNVQIRAETTAAGGRSEDIAAAQSAVVAAQARLDLARKGPNESELASAEAAIVAANSNLSAAQRNLADLMLLPKPETIRTAELALQKERDTLNTLYINRDGICKNKGFYECNAARSTAAAQEGVVANAINNLQVAKTPPTAEQFKQVRDAITGAEAAVQSATTRLAYLRTLPNPEDITAAEAAVNQAISQAALKAAPYTDRDVMAANAQVAQAQAALDVTKAARNDANVIAPFAGVIAQRYLQEGAFASTVTPILSLISNDVEIAINIEESRIGLIQPGLPVALALTAYPDQTFPGKIASVNPTADPKTHTFTVKVVPTAQDPRVKGGMYAEVKITAERKQGAVLIPKEAVVIKTDKQVAFVVAENRASLRELTVGLSDDKFTEIVKGINADEMVVVQGQATLSDGDAVRSAGGEPGTSGTPAARPGGSSVEKPAAGQTPATSDRPGRTPAANTPTGGQTPPASDKPGGR
jgi:RND family efflux transporter MFP subunit